MPSRAVRHGEVTPVKERPAHRVRGLPADPRRRWWHRRGWPACVWRQGRTPHLEPAKHRISPWRDSPARRVTWTAEKNAVARCTVYTHNRRQRGGCPGCESHDGHRQKLCPPEQKAERDRLVQADAHRCTFPRSVTPRRQLSMIQDTSSIEQRPYGLGNGEIGVLSRQEQGRAVLPDT